MNLSAEQILRFLLSISVWSVAKILVCFALLLYLVFAIVVLRQISLMIETLNGQLELPLKAIALLHLFGAILVFVLAILLL